VHQAYGGHEEGGWWYECGEPVQSILLSDDDYQEWVEAQSEEMLTELNKVRDQMTSVFTKGQTPTPRKTGYGGYTFLPGSDYPVSYEMDNNYTSAFEGHFAEAYPKEKPRYE
jgi:hypothetical protein